jgi:hypothetical protein
MVMLHKGADHTTIAMHDQPARKPLSSSVNRVTDAPQFLLALDLEGAHAHVARPEPAGHHLLHRHLAGNAVRLGCLTTAAEVGKERYTSLRSGARHLGPLARTRRLNLQVPANFFLKNNA